MSCKAERHEWQINDEQRHPSVGQRCVCGETEWPACHHRERNPNFDGTYCNTCRRDICPFQEGRDAPTCAEPSDGISPWCAIHHKRIDDLADEREARKPVEVTVTLERLTEAMRRRFEDTTGDFLDDDAHVSLATEAALLFAELQKERK